MRKWPTSGWIALLAVAALLVLAGVFRDRDALSRGQLAGPETQPESRPVKPIYQGPRSSLAILPFADGSAAGDQAWLGQGLAWELIRRVAAVPEARITAPTSAFFFAGSGIELDIIAQRLQTRHLLTGQSALVNGRLEVSARLFDARRGRVTWAASFDHPLVEAAAQQDELLGPVLAAMGLSGAVVPAGRPVDPEAWLQFLQGRYLAGQPSEEAPALAEAHFRSALGPQPDYADAWLGVAQARLAAVPAQWQVAEDALEAALRAVPGSPDALGLKSYIRRVRHWDWLGAVGDARQALQGRPGDARLAAMLARACFAAGAFREAARRFEDAVELDPINLSLRPGLGLAQEFAGSYEAALASYRRLIALNADYPGVHALRARVKILQGKPDSALREAEAETAPLWRAYARSLALVAGGEHDLAEQALADLQSDHGDALAFQMAEIRAFRGEADRAFEWLDKAREERDGGLVGLSGNGFLENLHGDPRWVAFLTELGLPLDGNGRSD